MNKGFTLLELLVVVMIMGILTSIAIPQYNRSVRRAELIEGLSQGKTIFDSALRYKSSNGAMPTYFNELDIGFTGLNTSSSSLTEGNFTYSLQADGLKVTSNVGGYYLKMQLPVMSDTGVSAPIYCCPSNGDENGEWLCKSVSGGLLGTGGCYEIK